MPSPVPPPSRPLFPVCAALSLSAAALLALFAAAPAAVADTAPDGPADGIEHTPTPAEHYAELLAEEPEDAAVVVDGATGGTVPPDELAEGVHAAFEPLGVPYYVVVTPFVGAGSPGGTDEILPAVHDRLGADGLYVLLPPSGGFTEVLTHGVGLSEDDARTAVYDADLYGVPAHDVARTMAAGLAGDAPPPVEADDAEDGFLAGLHPTANNGPENLGLLVGTAGGALLVIGGVLAWRAGSGGRPGPASAAVLLPLTAFAAAVVGTYTYTVNEPPGGSEVVSPEDLVRTEEPYVASTARVERIAATFAGSPLHVDPLAGMDREGLTELPDRLEEASVPVYAAVVPLATDDETEGNAEVLAAALASVAEEDGVYLVVGPGVETPDVGASVKGLEIDAYSLWSAATLIEETTPAAALEQAVAEMDQLEFTPGDGFEPSFADADPILPGPRSERYWVEGLVPGALVVGPLLGAAAVGLAALGLYMVRRQRGQIASPVLSRGALRRTAARETARLRDLLDRSPEQVPDAFMPQAEIALLYAECTDDELGLLGSAVLARRVLTAAHDPEASTEPCTVNPLHPFAAEHRRTRITGGKAPLCAECARLGDAVRSERVLRLRSRTTAHPYRAAPKSPWIRHRFGAHDPERMTGTLLEATRAR
ncbi:hypothetical protein IDM40_12820 [Nocardiopsis sp. HNM0947]|uniref:DUF4350 domain-containing protein n=1 Tax=Nocardiopsis coralli TaxID=2772213 RepID=A0ABR9P6X6_9ACTN|nr:hypothetical protein [Nocardiopsis coralli]MBE2999583.1 hypothetical protein [Nocardiopsis coralli]